jgi:hypothetical protein
MADSKKTDEERQPRDGIDTIRQADEEGFVGRKVDPTPNENYTLSGVVAGKPTPESDPEHAAQVQAQVAAGDAGTST